MSKSKPSIRKNIFIILLAILYFIIQYIQSRFNGTPMASFNGILMSFEFICCLLMILINYNGGIVVTCICMSYSMISILHLMILSKNHPVNPLPGLINPCIYLLTLLLLVKQFKNRDKESITDFLTGLRNRRGLFKILEKQIQNNKTFYVVYIDLGNFKLLNDTYGHTFGDRVLKSVTEKMTTRIGNDGIATRIGGDEFVLVLNENSKVYQITQDILDDISQKVVEKDEQDNELELYISACAGIAKFPFDTRNPEDLIKYADIAMYEASKNKNSRIVRFDQGMADKITRQVEIEHLINEGLEKDYFYMVYQPQYMLEGKKLRGFESLLRLKSPEGVFVSPAEFIPVAEKKDLILKIDDYVLCRVMKEFKEIVEQKSDLIISVNVSAKNIANLNFPRKIKKYLEQTGFPAKNLEIEITEYCMVQSIETTIENISALHNMGVQVALDDFGTGYTSLSYLAKMPINLLKVDKSLIDDIESTKKSQEFVNAVIAMGHLMGCEVIAEGTETESQLEILTNQQCDFVQGYIWGKPLDYDIAKELSLK